MGTPIIEFQNGMTLVQRFKSYARYVLDGGFVYDDKTRAELVKLFDTFENSGRGVMVYGNTGTGKTMLFKILERVIHPDDHNKFRIIPCGDLVQAYNIDGHEVFRQYNQMDMLFDDLGAEETGVYFGDKINVMERVILHRYNLWRDAAIRSHFTTNLKQSEVEQKYGTRVMGRLMEMNVHYLINDADKRTLNNFRGFPVVHHRKTDDVLEFEKRYAERMAAVKLENESRPKFKGSGSRLREMLVGKYGPLVTTTDSTPFKKGRKRK